MVPKRYIQQWRINAPWPVLSMVEQDLIISRALIDLYRHPDINKSLALRGGSALNRLFLKQPVRYSEYIHLVQIESAPIGKTLDAIREALAWLGEPKRRLTERGARLTWHYPAVNKQIAKLRIKLNTTDHFYITALSRVPYEINCSWYQGKAELLSYPLEEQAATKLRALYQRRQGRDLFDLWYILKHNLVDIDLVVSIFNSHCQYNQHAITRPRFEQNLSAKKHHRDFFADVSPLLANNVYWDLDEALDFIQTRLLSHLPDESWIR